MSDKIEKNEIADLLRSLAGRLEYTAQAGNKLSRGFYQAWAGDNLINKAYDVANQLSPKTDTISKDEYITQIEKIKAEEIIRKLRTAQKTQRSVKLEINGNFEECFCNIKEIFDNEIVVNYAMYTDTIKICEITDIILI